MTMEGASQEIISRNGLIEAPVIRKGGLRRLHGVPYATNKLKMPPFLGLVQTCQAIRNEYRPWYVSHPKVSVRDVQLYIHAFIQRPRLHWKKAFEVDTLQSVTIMTSLCIDLALIPLLRLRALHPSIIINVESAEPELDDQVEPLDQIFNNENELWLRWVKTGAMTQARLAIGHAFGHPRGPVPWVCFHVVLQTRESHRLQELRAMFDDFPDIGLTTGVSG
jgi:hypothetical protein